jgi:hypothetical protein
MHFLDSDRVRLRACLRMFLRGLIGGHLSLCLQRLCHQHTWKHCGPSSLQRFFLVRQDNVDLVLLSPSGIHTKQYVLKGVMKLVMALSSSFI